MGSRKKLAIESRAETAPDKSMGLSVQLKDLDQLVKELTSDHPKLEVIRAQMARLGIDYSEDATERMSRVLFLIQKIQFDFAQDLPEFKSSQNMRTKRLRKDGIEI